MREAGGGSPLRVEGVRDLQWVLVDYGDVVVHVFHDDTRRFYDIERLYQDVPRVEWEPLTAARTTDHRGRRAATGGPPVASKVPCLSR